MKAERIILSFVAVLIGLAVAGIAFYLYQMTKTVDTVSPKHDTLTVATPTIDANNYLTLLSPRDESVTDKKTISVSGSTAADAILVVSTETNEQVVKPALNGNFTLTESIDEGYNLIQITAIFPNGEEKTILRTISYTNESF